jgi:hypothetical protein
MVRRNIDDIIREQDRLGWDGESTELGKYRLRPDDGPIAAVKYEVWERQKDIIANWYEVDYEEIKGK